LTDHRFILARREALLSVALTFAYILFWALCAYLPDETLPGMSGLPLWFELSCVLVPVIFVVLAVLMVRFLFTEVSLDANDEKTDTAPQGKHS
jgi:uncharacterized membrane protein YhdT